MNKSVQNKLAKKWDEKLLPIWKEINNLTREQTEELGEKAMSKISDYPIYASTSGIDYCEAILVGLVLFGDSLFGGEK